MYDQIKSMKIEEALRSAQMRMLWHQSLHNQMDFVTLAELAELAIEQGHYEEAIEYSEDAI